MECRQRSGQDRRSQSGGCLNRNDENWGVRRKAAEALGEIGGPKVVEPLIEAIKNDEDKDVRWTAARALGKIGGPKAVDALIEAMKKDEDEDVKNSAARALDEIYRALDPSNPLRKKIEKTREEK